MNVIIIMEDSLRKDHLGCYGNTWIKTPNIDKFATESTVFEGAYGEGVPTLPLCIPTKYVHSPVEVCHLDDMENLVKLLVHVVDEI